MQIVCKNDGHVYGKQYVESLYYGIRNNLPNGRPGTFVCYTDDPESYAEGIEKKPLATFSHNNSLYLSLDICITGPLDALNDGLTSLDEIRDTFPDLVMDYEAGKEPKGSIVCFSDPLPHECKGDWVEPVWKDGKSLVKSWEIVGNTDAALLKANILHALSLPLELLADQYMIEDVRPLLIVGGGPSLEDNLEEIRAMQKAGAIVWSLNNTFRYLCERGIEPQAHIMFDARIENIDFVPLKTTALLLYGAQCHPEVLTKAMEAGKVIVWCPSIAEILDILNEQKKLAAIVSGGSSVGLKALGLAHLFGFSDIHLFGYDSSYRDDKNHAYPQPLNGNERIVDITVNDRIFKCAPWMATQTEEFKFCVGDFLAKGMKFTVHGDGLLPYIAKVISQPLEKTDLLRINYDLSERPAAWSFFEWMTNIQFLRRNIGNPPLQICFKTKSGFRKNEPCSISNSQKQLIVDNVCRAALPLFDATETPESGLNVSVPHTLRTSVEAYRKTPVFPDMKPNIYTRQDIITITLREADYWPERNSNVEEWVKFAQRLDKKVFFVRDTAKAWEPIDGFETLPHASLNIMDRFGLYRTAAMNFFVSNGPASLAICDQKIPYICFIKTPITYRVNTDAWWREYIGIGIGEQWPWATSMQRMVLAEDMAENIEAAYNNLLQANGLGDIQEKRSSNG